jgi:CheY-like chemotaxis protein
MDQDLKGRRILVVEDSPGVAEVTGEMLREFGCEVVGPTGNMGIATGYAETKQLDAAIVDVNIRGWKIYPLARILASRDIPFVLTSGYSEWDLPDDLEGRPVLDKPYSADRLRHELSQLLAGRPARSREDSPAADNQTDS